MLQSNYITYFKSPITGRSNNDKNNKYRENVITNMCTFDRNFYEDEQYGEDWINFTMAFKKALTLICNSYDSYTIQHKGGRRFNYDYVFTFFDKDKKIVSEEKVEFKYNATQINETPQFVSPANPSQYLSQSFEEYYYDNYFSPFLQENNLPIPERNIYIKTIGNDSPECVKELQELYYKGAKGSSRYTGEEKDILFYNQCKNMSKESIAKFVTETHLKTDELTAYLISSQHNKLYLLYKNGRFTIQRTNNDDYIIESYAVNKQKNGYEAITKTGKKMNILLRWKNGNGIAYPAFQIS
jgi:hypothetical protein